MKNNVHSINFFFHFQNASKMKLALNESKIMWPGRLLTKPEGFLIPTHLKVLTIEEKPFVYVRELAESECNADEIICPHFNATDLESKLFVTKI